MRFAWQGFRLEHPDDWSPVALSGTRREGYVRLASPTRVAAQIRWKRSPQPGDLSTRLRTYFARLEKDAKRAKQPFKSTSDWDGERLEYRWVGNGQGRGALFASAECGRVFFVEVNGGRKDSLKPPARCLVDGFASGPVDGREPWALLGLDVSLPEGLVVEKKLLVSGRTGLTFKGRGYRIQADRWGFGAQLLAKHGLEPWARAALHLKRGEALHEHWGIRFAPHGRLGRTTEALVRFDEFENQMVAVVVRGGRRRRRPEWDWLL